ncbi:hypothetical protein R1sor_021842 [Riccia sorocarpa]|uniref:Uncharacterized protein n=1 Tax=Riccia sorocarpa TaxID=122646 RepID=A0ABD3GJV3_9MARC
MAHHGCTVFVPVVRTATIISVESAKQTFHQRRGYSWYSWKKKKRVAEWHRAESRTSWAEQEDVLSFSFDGVLVVMRRFGFRSNGVSEAGLFVAVLVSLGSPTDRGSATGLWALGFPSLLLAQQEKKDQPEGVDKRSRAPPLSGQGGKVQLSGQQEFGALGYSRGRAQQGKLHASSAQTQTDTKEFLRRMIIRRY